MWDEALDPLVSLTPHRGDASAAFDFWRLTGRKSLQHDGDRLLLTGDTANARVRVHIGDGLCHAMPYSYVIAAGASVEQYRRALDPVVDWMRSGEPASYGRTYPRPALGPIVHMRALQAHDGVSAGASQREVAAILFGDDVVAERWTPDSELRAHVRYLVGRARSLINLGYISLFGSKRLKEETTTSIEKTP